MSSSSCPVSSIKWYKGKVRLLRVKKEKNSPFWGIEKPDIFTAFLQQQKQMKENKCKLLVETMSVWENVSACVKQLTSGARYSGVPQKVFMVASGVMPSLQRPKSVIFIWPSLSSIRFSSWERVKWHIMIKIISVVYSRITLLSTVSLWLSTEYSVDIYSWCSRESPNSLYF